MRPESLQIFWLKQKNLEGEKERNSFLWLNLVDRKNDGKSLQKIINIWMQKYSKYKNNIWDSSVLSKRIISWMLNVDIILNNGFFEFKKKFLDSLICVNITHFKIKVIFFNALR